MRRILKTVLAAGLLASGSACVYHMPIQQGNYLDPAMLSQVKPGMTRAQVRFLLGTPIAPVAFDDSRWEYDYYLKSDKLKKPNRSHATVYFENELVARVDTNVRAAVPTQFIERSTLAPDAAN